VRSIADEVRPIGALRAELAVRRETLAQALAEAMFAKLRPKLQASVATPAGNDRSDFDAPMDGATHG
jgi:hypothetical protein